MDMFALQPIRSEPALVAIKTLELAPEGWRACVERIAEGFAERIGEHAYCLTCGNVVCGVQGHDATCLTMVARRILANEPFLHALKSSPAKLRRNDEDAAHRRQPVDITIPVFLSSPSALAN